MRLMTDAPLRQALHTLYVALFNARQTCREDFSDGRLTTIQTAFMGVENYGWRVVGITREALDLLASSNFDKGKLPRRLCRGHITDRRSMRNQMKTGRGRASTVSPGSIWPARCFCRTLQ